jgi:hypothetical protein
MTINTIVCGMATFSVFLSVISSLLPFRAHIVADHFMKVAQVVAVCAVALALLSR